jgi:cytoskeletal protein CcmA (bactofilin family)
VVVAEGEVIDGDLYAGGETVTIDGRIRGDLVASGREVTLNGAVEGDLMACGQGVVINGRVGDDVRMAGMALKLGSDAEVTGDLLTAGMSLETEPGGRVNGSLVSVGYQALLAGWVGDDVISSHEGLELKGAVGGKIEAEVGADREAPPFISFIPSPVVMPTVRPGLTVTETASIGGELVYFSKSKGRIDPGAVESDGVTWKQVEPQGQPQPTAGQRLIAQLRWLIALLIAGLLLLWLVPGWVRGLAETVRDRPLPSVGWGLVALIGIPIAMLILVAVVALIAVIMGALTLGRLVALVIGLGLLSEGALALGFWITIGLIAHIVVGSLLGSLVLERFRPERAGGRMLALLVGLVILAILGAVPYLGGILRLLVALLGLGAVCLWLYGRGRMPEPAPAT